MKMQYMEDVNSFATEVFEMAELEKHYLENNDLQALDDLFYNKGRSLVDRMCGFYQGAYSMLLMDEVPNAELGDAHQTFKVYLEEMVTSLKALSESYGSANPEESFSNLLKNLEVFK